MTPTGAGVSTPSTESIGTSLNEHNRAGVATSVADKSTTKVVSPGYKQTKVGVIPEEWEALPAKNYFTKSIAKGYDGLEIYSVTLNKSWQKRSDLEREIGSDVDIDKSLLAEKGDLVYNTMRMWQGALGLAENAGVVSPAYIVLKPKEIFLSVKIISLSALFEIIFLWLDQR